MIGTQSIKTLMGFEDVLILGKFKMIPTMREPMVILQWIEGANDLKREAKVKIDKQIMDAQNTSTVCVFCSNLY